MIAQVKNGVSNTLLFILMMIVAAVVYAGLYFSIAPFVFNEGQDNASFIALHDLWLLVAVLYIIFSFRFKQTIGPDEIGFRQFFGKPAGELQSGLPLVPLGLFTLKKFKRTIQQKEFPAEPEMIYRGEMKSTNTLPEGMKPPVRQSFRTNISDKQAREFFGDGTIGPADNLYSIENPHKPGDMITFNYSVPNDGLGKKRVTAELYPVLRWRIYDVKHFVSNIGSEDEVEKQIEDEIFSVLNRICQQISLAQALQNQQWLNAILFHAVAQRIKATKSDWKSDEWGIELESVFIKYPHLSHGLNQSIADASQATFEAQRTVTLANAEKKKLIEEGKGAAQASEALAFAELKGFGQGLHVAADVTGMSAEAIAAAKVAGQIADGGNTVIIGSDGFTQLMGLATAAGKGMDSRKGGKDE